MEYYFLVKQIHITTAVLSLLGFIVRVWWSFTDNDWLQQKIVKVAPHINDTLLLGAAIYLSAVGRMYPFIVPWLGAKVVLLIGYIGAGAMALKRGKTNQARILAFFVAVACISGIFYLAIFKPILI